MIIKVRRISNKSKKKKKDDSKCKKDYNKSKKDDVYKKIRKI